MPDEITDVQLYREPTDEMPAEMRSFFAKGMSFYRFATEDGRASWVPVPGGDAVGMESFARELAAKALERILTPEVYPSDERHAREVEAQRHIAAQIEGAVAADV